MIYFTLVVVPYEATFYTGEVNSAGTDCTIKLTVFGEGGSSSEQTIEKKGDRFERGREDNIKMDLDDIAPLKKIRVQHDGKGSRPDWFLEKVGYHWFVSCFIYHCTGITFDKV